METINVCLCCDENYAEHTGVVIASILENSSSPYNFFILNDGLTKETKQTFGKITKNKNIKINFINIQKNSFFKRIKDKNPNLGHLTPLTFGRLLAPEMLGVKRLIYLDSDIVVEGDLIDLWNLKLGDFILGATPGGWFGEQEKNNGPSFNAGVLLIDCDKWKNKKITEKAFNFILSSKENGFSDEVALNKILNGNFLDIGGGGIPFLEIIPLEDQKRNQK